MDANFPLRILYHKHDLTCSFSAVESVGATKVRYLPLPPGRYICV